MLNIFNRDEYQHPADGWYQIERAGEHPNRAAGVVQVVDGDAGQSITSRFNADAKAGKLQHGHEMLIDREHWKHDANKETTAYGWLQELQNRDDGIYGRIRWTDTGKAAVDGGDYRFFSTEYNPADVKVLDTSKPEHVRPLRLAGLTLTNMPNNRGQKAITNREQHPHPSETIPGHPEPALEGWFQAVTAMVQGIQNVTKTATIADWDNAWKLCKKQHPELYVAAFGDLSADPYADPAAPGEVESVDPQNDAALMTQITNRVRTGAKCDFHSAWNFTRQQLPRLFNRGENRRAPVMNRNDSAAKNERGIQQEASLLAKTLADQEVKRSGISFQIAWGQIRNREQTLFALANGEITAKEAHVRQPDLMRRIGRNIVGLL